MNAICSRLIRQVDEAIQVFFKPQQQQLIMQSTNIIWVCWEPPDLSRITQFRWCNYTKSPLEVELLGILKGLQLAWECQYKKLSVEVDFNHAIRLINLGCQDAHPMQKIVELIQNTLRREWCDGFHHALREANQLQIGWLPMAFNNQTAFSRSV
ncbi:Ribonuclease H superfamily [Sesbania bispinosa]|nr:Ribonuclease H superfamily [Sesbania bispinosa]